MKTLHLSITFLAQMKLMSQQQLNLLFDTIETSKPFCLKKLVIVVTNINILGHGSSIGTANFITLLYKYSSLDVFHQLKYLLNACSHVWRLHRICTKF
jgi:hypothetical protein